MSEKNKKLEPGSRVGAILNSDENQINFIGYGVYEGDFVPPKPPFMKDWEEFDKLGKQILGDKYTTEMRLKSPKIKLDNGTVVWGLECWWGTEKSVQEVLAEIIDEGKKKIVNVNIDEMRKETEEAEAKVLGEIFEAAEENTAEENSDSKEKKE